MVLANDLPFSGGQEDPKESLRSTLALASKDWGESRSDAWIWGIVLGWDDGDDPGEAMTEMAERHGWDTDAVTRLRRLHDAFKAL